jgi:nitroreductase
MNFKDLVKARYSVRQFKDEPIDREKLEMVLDAGRMAPSAVNIQPWHFIVVREKENLQAVWSCYSREWFKSAPAVIVVCGDCSEGWRRSIDGKNHTDIDAAIAIDHMTLQAADLGLGTCWVCNFNPALLKNILQLPENVEPIAMLPIGVPVEDSELSSQTKKRKSFSQIVHWEKF